MLIDERERRQNAVSRQVKYLVWGCRRIECLFFLNLGAKIVEFSNELWNPLFPQGPAISNDPNFAHYSQVVAPAVMQIRDAFHNEYGVDADRFNIVLAGQTPVTGHVEAAIQAFLDAGRDPNDVIDALAIGPYFGPDNYTPYTDLDSLFTGFIQQQAGIQAHQAIADQHGLPMIGYEGGQGLQPIATSFALLEQAQTDPRMADAYRNFAEIWDADAGGLFMHYALSRPRNQFGFYSLLDDIRDPAASSGIRSWICC